MYMIERGKTVTDILEYLCDEFVPLTHQNYIDAGCYGCEHCRIFVDGTTRCDVFHLQRRKYVKTKYFGEVETVVRYGNKKRIFKKDDKSRKFMVESV